MFTFGLLAVTLATQAPAAPCAAEGVAVQVVEGGILEAATTRLGTNLKLGVTGKSCEDALKIYKEVYTEFDRLEGLFDDEQGPLAAVNAGAGQAAVVVPDELFDLVSRALAFAAQTEGAFDPTFAAMIGLWRFDGSDKLPTDAEIERRRALVDYRAVQLDKAAKSVRLMKAGMRLELGGIAKGYAIDRAVSILLARGATDFVVRSGGELYIHGAPGGAKPQMGVPNPRAEGRPLASVEVKDAAANISSDDQKFFVKDGVRYHDKIDPKTGRPATRSRVVSVVSKDATTADALSTAIFVMGPQAGLKLVESLEGVEVIIQGADGSVHLSSGLSASLFGM